MASKKYEKKIAGRLKNFFLWLEIFFYISTFRYIFFNWNMKHMGTIACYNQPRHSNVIFFTSTLMSSYMNALLKKVYMCSLAAAVNSNSESGIEWKIAI